LSTAKIIGDKLLIYFESYGENNKFETYEQGDLLLNLEKKSLKDKIEILTTGTNSGKLFRKTKN
jgi:hypothetical protein